jgi:hypothetical protein
MVLLHERRLVVRQLDLRGAVQRGEVLGDFEGGWRRVAWAGHALRGQLWAAAPLGVRLLLPPPCGLGRVRLAAIALVMVRIIKRAASEAYTVWHGDSQIVVDRSGVCVAW